MPEDVEGITADQKIRMRIAVSAVSAGTITSEQALARIVDALSRYVLTGSIPVEYR
jgi:hypothetical protein